MRSRVLLLMLVLAGDIRYSRAWRSVSVTEFGAIGDNKTDNTEAFRAATRAVDGGGEIIVPSGIFQTAPFNLTSNVVLHVDGTVRGVENRSKFPKIGVLPSYGFDLDTRGPARRQPLVFSVGASNVSVSGAGVIDGAGWYWYPEFSNSSIDPKVGRPHLMEFQNCSGVEISGVTLLNSAFWTLHPVYCHQVHIHDMTIQAPWCQNYGCANTDGIDIDSSTDVVVERNTINCGDDHVTVISGAGAAGRAFGMPSRNVTVRDNILGTGMGLSIGSSTSGGVEGVLYINNTMTELSGEWGQGAHLKTRVSYGGYVRDVAWVDCTFAVSGDPGGALVIESDYQSNGNCTSTTCTEVRDIVFRNLTFLQTGSLGSIECYKERPCVNVTFDNVHIAAPGPWDCQHVASGTVTNVTPAGLAAACGFAST